MILHAVQTMVFVLEYTLEKLGVSRNHWNTSRCRVNNRTNFARTCPDFRVCSAARGDYFSGCEKYFARADQNWALARTRNFPNSRKYGKHGIYLHLWHPICFRCCSVTVVIWPRTTWAAVGQRLSVFLRETGTALYVSRYFQHTTGSTIPVRMQLPSWDTMVI